MKIFKYLIAMVAMMMCVCTFTSCGHKEDVPTDCASAVKGVYTGKLTIDNVVIEDAYVVYVSKISSTVVNVQADFYGDDDSENFNVVYENGQYLFLSETSANINITVTGKNMNLNYLNTGGYIVHFSGVRD